MRTMRPGATPFVCALASLLLTATAMSAQQQRDPYPATLQFGTGLVNIPVAWISPISGDIWANSSGKQITHYIDPAKMNFATKWNTNLSIETHWLGRFSVGAAAYSQNPEWGFYGQALLVRDNQFGPIPAIAVGVRNIGPYDHSDRLLIAHDIQLEASGNYEEVTSDFFKDFKTTPTIYGVATKEFGFGNASGSLTVGYGNGLFSEDGGLGDTYNTKGQVAEGLFFGTRIGFHPTTNTTLTFLGENDGWDWNAGVVGDWRGITLGLYGTELEEGSKSPDKGPLYRVYNYAKMNVTFGYHGNIYDIARGVLLRARVSDLEREQGRLRNEITRREARIRDLEVALRKAQAGELAEIAKRRELLEQQIQEERDAIRRVEERLRQLQEGRPPTPPPSGGSTPPRV
ncbi:MAG: hypothetical protein ABR543_07270 [Gemmatimonadaceae bacterium]